jgi:fructosamine-3-kinase
LNVPEPVIAWLAAEGYGGVVELQPVAGGCINQGAILRTAGGPSFFLKQNADAPEAMFLREVEGLRALVVEGGPRLPSALLAGADFLLLEDLRPAAPASGYWENFGRQLARLHAHTSDTFGFPHDNFLGTTPQPNPPTPDGFEFFAVNRLEFQARLADERGRLPSEDRDKIHKLSRTLRERIPEQPASLIHGDLWSGNALTGPAGEPAIIDPAAHYGWAEAELGMTELFGGFPDRFYVAYLDARPLESGWRERLPIYNLYHLLNHVNLFGGGYLGQVQAILKRYV